MACNYLRSRGYAILERNWRYQKAEIDILALKGNTLAVVEVKTRSTDAFGDPNAFVRPNQVRLLRKAAHAYVTRHRLNLEVRFDFIGIVCAGNREKLTHLEDACFIF